MGGQLPAEWIEGGSFRIAECGFCRMVYQVFVLRDQHLPQLYATNRAETRLATDLSLRSLAHLAQDVIVMKQSTSAQRPRVLDYGMGWARFAMLAQAYNCEVHGVEMSQSTRDHGRQHGILVLEEDELETGAYDVVVVDQVLEHLIQPLTLMRRLASCLRKGGLMLIGVPGREGLSERLQRAALTDDPIAVIQSADLDALYPLVHLNLFCGAAMKSMAEQSGMECFKPSFWTTVGAGQLWDQPRQWNRNLLVAWRYSRGKGSRSWFRRRDT